MFFSELKITAESYEKNYSVKGKSWVLSLDLMHSYTQGKYSDILDAQDKNLQTFNTYQ